MSRSRWTVRPGSERNGHCAPTEAELLRVSHRDPRLERRQLEVLLVFLRAVVAAGKREDHRVVALKFAEGADRAGVIGKRVVREEPPGHDVGTHGLLRTTLASSRPSLRWLPSGRREDEDDGVPWFPDFVS